jgi:hypothetical protein
VKSDKLQVTFDPGAAMDLPITLPEKLPAKKKKKHSAQMQEAAAFAKFGVQVLRVKAQTLAALGKNAEAAGIRQISHGRILLAADNAEQAVQTLGGIVEDMLTSDEPVDKAVVLDIMRCIHAFNAQILATATAHLTVDKQPVAGTTEAKLTLPFPSGSPVMVAIGKAGAGDGKGQ